MQFYLDGYRPGDPLMHDAHPGMTAHPDGLPPELDVLIVGCGPAGLVLAAQLANIPEIRTAVVDRRDGPLDVGQADGVACRTVEIFETFGLADRLLGEAYWVNEVCFWEPDPDHRASITRTGRVRDTEEGLSEFPHVIVNQARMLAYLLEHMERSPSRLAPHYGLHCEAVEIDADGGAEFPVSVTLRHVENFEPTGRTSTLRAKYVVGCDGSRSGVRSAIGRTLAGDPMNVSWGVMDALTTTDFPDIRMKCTIHSAGEGSLLIIPREGGYLNRFYIELDRDREMLENHSVTPEKLADVANRILHPYSIEVKDVGWWSVYDIGQRLTDRFDDVPAAEIATRLPRVFIAGDACHTHSAKAGQGMNVSMADTWNLGWKLTAVLRGTAKPELLHTYSEERQRVAQELIDFDLEFATMFSARPRDAGEVGGDGGGIAPEEFHRYFVQQGRFTAGVATRYLPSLITRSPEHQQLATDFRAGMRFHSAPVIRLADGRPLQLGHVARADGAWRLYIFADRPHPGGAASRARALCDFLASDASPLARFTPADWAPDSVIDVRGIFQQPHRELSPSDMPAVLLPRKGRLGLIDYEKAFCPDPSAGDIFELRGISRDDGCIVIVRPDQYVSDVLPLSAHSELSAFFERILLPIC